MPSSTPSAPIDEKRHRNLSIGCISRHSPCPYPGFSAYLGSITRVSGGHTTFHPFGSIDPLSPQSCVGVFNSMYCQTPSEYTFTPMFDLSTTPPPLVTPEGEEFEEEEEEEMRKKESSSSGYGSESEHDLISLRSDDRGRSRHRTLPANSLSSVEIIRRRRSMPPSCCFENDVTQVLCKDGYANFETNVDTGERIRKEIRGMSRPESVLQLARKFGEISAAQHNEMHKSRLSLGKENLKRVTVSSPIISVVSKSGPPTPAKQATPAAIQSQRSNGIPIGGIASLKSSQKMSRPNMFKQMDKVGSGSPAVVGPPRQLNPNSIKDALLRWIQNRVAGYPNVNVTNFSSSWADGMAFCALIHRFAPNSFDFSSLDPKNRRYNFDLAFRVAEENGIFPLLEVDDMIMMGDRPDWKCVFTYVQSFYKQFRDRP